MKPLTEQANNSKVQEEKESILVESSPPVENFKDGESFIGILALSLISAFLAFLHIGSDILLVLQNLYVTIVYPWGLDYFCLTLSCIIISSMVFAFFQQKMYLNNPTSILYEKERRKRILSMLPVISHYALFQRRIRRIAENNKGIVIDKDELQLKVIVERSMRFLEIFVKSTPMIAIQIHFLFNHDPYGVRPLQLVSIWSSVISLAHELSAYNEFNVTQNTTSWIGWIGLYFGHFCYIGSRVFAFTVVAQKCAFLLIFQCAIHFIAMLGWTSGDDTSQKSISSKICSAWMYLFVFISFEKNEAMKEGWKYLATYSTFMIENVMFLLMCSLYLCTTREWRSYTLDIIRSDEFCWVFGTFILNFLGLLLILFFINNWEKICKEFKGFCAFWQKGEVSENENSMT